MRKALSASDKKLFKAFRNYLYTENLELKIKDDAPEEAKKAFIKYMSKEQKIAS